MIVYDCGLRNIVEFLTTLPNDSETEYVPSGKYLMHWLHAQLQARGLTCHDIWIHESFGWEFFVTSGRQSVWCLLQGWDPVMVSCYPDVPVLRRLFGRAEYDLVRRCIAALQYSLSGDVSFSNIRWYTHREYREQSFGAYLPDGPAIEPTASNFRQEGLTFGGARATAGRSVDLSLSDNLCDGIFVPAAFERLAYGESKFILAALEKLVKNRALLKHPVFRFRIASLAALLPMPEDIRVCDSPKKALKWYKANQGNVQWDAAADKFVLVSAQGNGGERP